MNTLFKIALRAFGLMGVAAIVWWLAPSEVAPQAQQSAPLLAQAQMVNIIDFEEQTEESRWRNVDDTVMGGVSQSAFSITPNGYGLFSGTLSLENNGGFTSVRRSVDDAGLTGAQAIVLRVKGDGRVYQFRLRMNESNRDISYRSEFETSGEWQTVRLPIESFEPVFRGRIVAGAPTLEPGNVRQLGFLLASKESGSFTLEIESIQSEL